jgi:hypothetical protein
MLSFDASTTAMLASLLPLLTALVTQRRSLKSGARAQPVADPALDTVVDWPPQAVRVLSLPERQAYNVLRKAVPSHLVLAQVPLSRFISVPTGRSYSQWLHRAGRLTVDLVICDFSSRPIAVVEVRSGSETERSRQRHERVAEVLKSAGIAVHVWRESALPTVTEARQLFIPKADEAPQLDRYGRPVLPVADMQELLAAGDEVDYKQHEPVPSTFFDELDTLPPQRGVAVPA